MTSWVVLLYIELNSSEISSCFFIWVFCCHLYPLLCCTLRFVSFILLSFSRQEGSLIIYSSSKPTHLYRFGERTIFAVKFIILVLHLGRPLSLKTEYVIILIAWTVTEWRNFSSLNQLFISFWGHNSIIGRSAGSQLESSISPLSGKHT